MSSLFSRLWRFLRGEPEVASLISNLEKQRVKLGSAAQKLKTLADQKEAEAKAALKAAEAKLEDSKWAQRIADKFEDFLK